MGFAVHIHDDCDDHHAHQNRPSSIAEKSQSHAGNGYQAHGHANVLEDLI